MDDKKKTFVKPNAEVVDFADDDIITLSSYDTLGFNEDGETEEWE